MSDIVIVSKDQFQNGYGDRVPYGAVLDDDAQSVSDAQTVEGLFEGAVPAVDWRGVDTPPRRRGRPRKVND